MDSNVLRQLEQENKGVRALAIRQLRKERRISRIARKRRRIFGLKCRLVKQLEGAQKNKRQKICRQIKGLLDAQRDIFYITEEQEKELSAVKKDIIHIIAMEILGEKELLKGDEEAYRVLSSKLRDIHFDQQHVIEDEEIFDKFKKLYGYEKQEEKGLEQAAAEEQRGLSEHELVFNVLRGLKENLSSQKEVITDISMQSDGDISQLVSRESELLEQESEKYHVLINYDLFEERIAAKLRSIEELKSPAMRRSLWVKARGLARRGVALAAIVAVTYSPVKNKIVEMYHGVFGTSKLEQRQTPNQDYWDEYQKKHGMWEFFMEYNFRGGKKRKPIETAPSKEEALKLTQVYNFVKKSIATGFTYIGHLLQSADNKPMQFAGTLLLAFAFVIKNIEYALIVLIYIFLRGIPILGIPLRFFERIIFGGLVNLTEDILTFPIKLYKYMSTKKFKKEMQRIIASDRRIRNNIFNVSYWSDIITIKIEEHKDKAFESLDRYKIRLMPAFEFVARQTNKLNPKRFLR